MTPPKLYSVDVHSSVVEGAAVISIENHFPMNSKDVWIALYGVVRMTACYYMLPVTQRSTRRSMEQALVAFVLLF